MPATLTHTYFALDVLKKLDKSKRDFLNNSIGTLKIAAQSTDPFMFYNLLNPCKSKKAKEVVRFAKKFHTTKTGEFLVELTEHIKKNNYINKSNVIAILYGYITHYVLDSSMHPYIYYKTGKFNSKEKSTYKYNGVHHIMETYIDNYLVKKREHVTPYKYKCYKTLEDTSGFDKEVKEVLNNVFKSVYNYDNFANDYMKSIKDMHFALRHLRYDPYGIKEQAITVMDYLTPKSILKYKFLSYHHITKDSEKYLNMEKKKWHYAADNKIIKDLSFDELYDETINKCASIITEVNNYLFNNAKIDLKKTYNNLSYETGLDWTLPKESKYFEF